VSVQWSSLSVVETDAKKQSKLVSVLQPIVGGVKFANRLVVYCLLFLQLLTYKFIVFP
jgi:hypothetical protein